MALRETDVRAVVTRRGGEVAFEGDLVRMRWHLAATDAEPEAARLRPRAMATTRRRARGALAVACIAIVATSCGQTTREPAAPSAHGGSEQSRATKPGPFDALAISVVLESDHVQSGDTLRSRLVVENASDKAVIDEDCSIGGGRYAIVPVDDPQADVWVQVTVDCGGPFRMKPGFREESSGPDFPAHTKYGDPLPPGEYLAVLEIRGLSHRLEYPVTVD